MWKRKTKPFKFFVKFRLPVEALFGVIRNWDMIGNETKIVNEIRHANRN